MTWIDAIAYLNYTYGTVPGLSIQTDGAAPGLALRNFKNPGDWNHG